MHISIDTSEALSNEDKAVLRALLGDASVPAAKSDFPAPAAKATKATAKKAVEPEETEPEVEPGVEPEVEDVAESGATLADAKALATKMVSNGEAAKVKAALNVVGAKKVSEIPEDQVDAFIAELS